MATILPFNLPLHSAKSRGFFIGATMSGAVMPPAGVPGVHATGMVRRLMRRGDSSMTLALSIDQPRPKSKPSVRTLVRPQPLNLSCVQRSATRMPGELVMRGPIRSVK